MEDKELISIIMAAYNAEKTIKFAIESVLKQTYSNWELLVIDDCSKDKTAEIIKLFNDERIKYLKNDKNSGVSITRKNGLEIARGQWIAILDSDDAWKEDKLEKQLQLARIKNAKLIFTGSTFMDNNGKLIDWQLHVPESLPYKQLLKQNLISNSSVLVRTDLYRKYYAIGDNMHEDFAMWLNITKDGVLAYGIDEPLLIYRLAKSSKSSNKFKAAKMNWNTYRYVGLNPINASYYMCWYTIKNLIKYSHLR